MRNMVYNVEILLALFCIIVFLWIIHRKRHLSVFKNHGIPGPKPNLLFGNIVDLYKKGPIQCHEDWVRKYGRVLGFFYGMKPVLLVADSEMLKNIFIKDFHKFTNREPFNPLYKYLPHDNTDQSIFVLPGKKWKDIRSVLSPSFTTAKMKQMEGTINSSIDTLMNILKEKSENHEVFDCFDVYQRVTLDVIARTAFNMNTDVQKNKESIFRKASLLYTRIKYTDPILFIGLCFPVLRWVCFKVHDFTLFVLNQRIRHLTLRKSITKALQDRRENPQISKKDLLQFMIDSKIYTDATEVKTEYLETGISKYETKLDKIGSLNKPFRKLTTHEIITSAYGFLVGGYETTSIALAFTTYLLGKYPDIQEKLYDSIHKIVEDGQKLEHSTVNSLPYLDKVLWESMRLYPPCILFTNRFAVEDAEYGDFKIPKGMLVQAPTYFLHHDPDLWEDPEKFDPERFNNKPNKNRLAFVPFGIGPRNCIGMRYAQLEAKLVLAHLVHNFKITLSDKQKDHLDFIYKLRTLYPISGIHVKLESRDSE